MSSPAYGKPFLSPLYVGDDITLTLAGGKKKGRAQSPAHPSFPRLGVLGYMCVDGFRVRPDPAALDVAGFRDADV